MVYRKKQYRKWHLGHLIRHHRRSLSKRSKVGGPRVCLTWHVQETCVNLTKFMLNNMLKVFTCTHVVMAEASAVEYSLAVLQMCFSMFIHMQLCFPSSRCPLAAGMR